MRSKHSRSIVNFLFFPWFFKFEQLSYIHPSSPQTGSGIFGDDLRRCCFSFSDVNPQIVFVRPRRGLSHHHWKSNPGDLRPFDIAGMGCIV